MGEGETVMNLQRVAREHLVQDIPPMDKVELAVEALESLACFVDELVSQASVSVVVLTMHFVDISKQLKEGISRVTELESAFSNSRETIEDLRSHSRMLRMRQ